MRARSDVCVCVCVCVEGGGGEVGGGLMSASETRSRTVRKFSNKTQLLTRTNWRKSDNRDEKKKNINTSKDTKLTKTYLSKDAEFYRRLCRGSKFVQVRKTKSPLAFTLGKFPT